MKKKKKVDQCQHAGKLGYRCPNNAKYLVRTKGGIQIDICDKHKKLCKSRLPTVWWSSLNELIIQGTSSW